MRVNTHSATATDYSDLALFKGVAREAIEGLLKGCVQRHLRSGETLLSPQQADCSLYLLLQGRLCVRETQAAPPLYTVEAGGQVGEAAVLDHKPQPYFVVAEPDARVLVIGEETFLTLINTSHRIACNYLLALSARLRSGPSAQEQAAILQQRYARLATTDPLTGLHNQRWAEEMLARQIMRASMGKQALSVVLLDIDKLGAFNSEFGTAAGDQAVYTVAHTIRENVRPTDLVARLGGDKFMVILPDTDLRGAKIAAEHLRATIAHTSVVIPNECVLPPVTVAIGAVQLGAFVGADKLIADANAALARASAAGGNCIAP